MPTTPGTPSSTPLTPQQTLEKVTGLITELGDDTPATPEPAAPAAPAAAEPVPPEHADPQPSVPADDTPEDETVYTVKVDGVPTEFTLGELKHSASSQAHNTQRAQELAEKEQRLEPEIRQRVAAEVAQERAEYQQGLRQVVAYLQQVQGEPDWLQKRQELPPEEFLKQKADWEASKANLERLRLQDEQLQQRAAADQQQQYLTYLRGEEDKLKAAVPEWYADLEKGKLELAKLKTFVKSYGVPDDQVQRAFTSSAAILLARDALKYRELHREPTVQAKAKAAAIKTAKPGTPDRPRPNAAQEKLLERVAKSGRGRDAMAAIESLLPD